MELLQGSIFTPDKKRYLTEEIEKELSILDKEISNSSDESYKAEIKLIKDELSAKLSKLYNKIGVVTPQETDDILALLAKSKKSRLRKGFLLGINRSTLYLVGFLALGVGVYLYYKKKQG